MSKCHICRRELDQPNRPDTGDCGGDCVRCMAECGDPGCICIMAEYGDVEFVNLAAQLAENETGE